VWSRTTITDCTVVLRPAKVLILDESTKGLYRGNEEAVMINILAHVRKHKQTLLVITHFCDGFIFLHQVNFIESYRQV
jgi:ABC-type transport system involved in cytochrome bd biosynthesis fused ATPase/permease subunit